MLHKLLKGLAPVAALAIGTLAAGCDGVNVQIGDGKAVPLAELDQSGPPPTALVVAGPDHVIVSEGKALSIAVSGDRTAVDALRFSLDDGTLGIMRAKDSWNDKGTATIRVTMPAPRSLVVAGSGTVEAAALNGDAELTIAGSGTARVARVTAGKLDTTIAGSGSLEAAGSADALKLTVAGSGSANMAGLKVAKAEITVAGSGDAEFASDGTVDASVLGSGSVTVNGRANCTINAMGSGTLNCKGGTTTARAKGKPKAPKPPVAPEAPPAPDAGE